MTKQAKQYPIPDESAMARLLETHSDDLAGLVLRLVWRAGLKREEICALTWERVDLDAALLRLPDREIPLEEETVRFLRRWEEGHRRGEAYVAISRRRKPFLPSGIFAAARSAMNEEGLKHIRVYDLRHDYVRRQFSLRPWHEALRVTGLSMTTFRGGLAERLGLDHELPAPPMPSGSAADGEYKLWRILQAERDTPAGVALWLSNQLGLNLKEIAELTWERVDFETDVLRLPDRETALTAGTRRVLEAVRARRRPGDDPHVILTVRSRKPMDNGRLATMVREALIRGGLGERRPQDFRKSAIDDDLARLLEMARAKGSITRAEAAERLGLSMARTYDRLRKLEEEGRLVLLKNRWYPPENAVSRGERETAILRYIAEKGPATSGEIAAFLGVGKDTAAKRLGLIVKAGDLYRRGVERRYCLTKQGANKITKS